MFLKRPHPEPPWAKRLRFWLVDEQYDKIEHLPDDHWQWEVRETAETICLKAMCLIFGHGAINDQCGIPTHRFCFRCSKSMPNAELDKEWQ